MTTINNGTDLFGVAKWIVNPVSGSGTQTSITSALSVASSGDTIFITPGTYTENFTVGAGINLTAFQCDGLTPNVTISGKITVSSAGTVTIAGINLQTNSDNCILVSGSVATILNLVNCNINCSNNTGISYTSSSSSSQVNLYGCTGNLGTTGIGLFSQSSTGTLSFNNSIFTNTGGSTTASTISAGSLVSRNSTFANPITSSSTGAISLTSSSVSATNTTALTVGGSGTSTASFCLFSSGTASAVSISQTLTMSECSVSSTNTNAITGAGTINYSGICFTNTSTTINTTTQTVAGTLQGSKNTAPTAGFLGEQIRATIASGSPQSLSNNTAANVTNISLTAGVWDVSSVAIVTCTGTATLQGLSISTTSATVGTNGDNYVFFATTAVATTGTNGLTLPSYRLTLTSTTTVYMVAIAAFSTGTANAYGRISATRVG